MSRANMMPQMTRIWSGLGFSLAGQTQLSALPMGIILSNIHMHLTGYSGR